MAGGAVAALESPVLAAQRPPSALFSRPHSWTLSACSRKLSELSVGLRLRRAYGSERRLLLSEEADIHLHSRIFRLYSRSRSEFLKLRRWSLGFRRLT